MRKTLAALLFLLLTTIASATEAILSADQLAIAEAVARFHYGQRSKAIGTTASYQGDFAISFSFEFGSGAEGELDPPSMLLSNLEDLPGRIISYTQYLAELNDEDLTGPTGQEEVFDVLNFGYMKIDGDTAEVYGSIGVGLSSNAVMFELKKNAQGAWVIEQGGVVTGVS